MTRKKTDAPVTPIRPQVQVSADELRAARDGLLQAERVALEALGRALAECPRTPDGIPGEVATLALGDERGSLARDLLTYLGPAFARHAQGA